MSVNTQVEKNASKSPLLPDDDKDLDGLIDLDDLLNNCGSQTVSNSPLPPDDSDLDGPDDIDLDCLIDFDDLLDKSIRPSNFQLPSDDSDLDGLTYNTGGKVLSTRRFIRDNPYPRKER